ncbi:hypothetical protein M2351_005633 [Azospirillum canadense]|nr:hypothetical protein [Azospirillum canadense]
MGKMPEEGELLDLFSACRAESIARDLPHSSFYFTHMMEHFLACGRREDGVRSERASPFVYAMQ